MSRTLCAPLGALLALLVLAQPAGGTTLVLPDGTERPQPWQTWVDRANVPTPDGRVVLHRETPCPDGSGALGCAGPGEIYLEDDDRYTFMHELGHLRDLGIAWDGVGGLRDWQRRKLSRALRLRHWDDERFADAFAVCALGLRVPRRELREFGRGYRPTWRQSRRVCHLVGRFV